MRPELLKVTNLLLPPQDYSRQTRFNENGGLERLPLAFLIRPRSKLRMPDYPAATRAGPRHLNKRCVLLGYKPRSHPQRDQQPHRNHQIRAHEHQANRAFFVELEPQEDPGPSQREETQ